jgi:hypothetical protein
VPEAGRFHPPDSRRRTTASRGLAADGTSAALSAELICLAGLAVSRERVVAESAAKHLAIIK